MVGHNPSVPYTLRDWSYILSHLPPVKMPISLHFVIIFDYARHLLIPETFPVSRHKTRADVGLTNDCLSLVFKDYPPPLRELDYTSSTESTRSQKICETGLSVLCLDGSTSTIRVRIDGTYSLMKLLVTR